MEKVRKEIIRIEGLKKFYSLGTQQVKALNGVDVSIFKNGKYTFLVSPKATKTEIKDAIEKIFKVKVVEISTLNVKPKEKRVGRYTGLTNRSKKAIVKLAEGMTIETN